MSNPRRIRVLVAEDNYYARIGTATVLRAESDIDVVGEAENGIEAVVLYAQLRPDVAVLDLKMPLLDGVAAVAAICREDPAARILILSHYTGEDNVAAALKVGARGYLGKDSHGPDLVQGVRTVASGTRFLPGAMLDRFVGGTSAPKLTGREQEVLRQMHRGMSNRDIGKALGIAERTVGLYVSSVIAKLGVKNRTEAVVVALERGLID